MFYLNEREFIADFAPNACNSFAVYQRRAMNNEQRVSQIMIQGSTQQIYSARDCRPLGRRGFSFFRNDLGCHSKRRN